MPHITELKGVKYDPELEEFLSSYSWHINKAGYVARSGRKRNGRYIEPQIVFMHRDIWKFVHGDLPKELDHINRDKADNRISNLRASTRELNTLNSRSVNVHRMVRGRKYWRTNLGRSSSLHCKSYELFCHAFNDVQAVKRKLIDERSS